MTSDAITLANAQIKAKAAATAAAKAASAKMAARVKAAATAPRAPDLPKYQRVDFLPTSRSKYLESINAAGLKEAARSMGLDIKFGLDAKSWLEKNPQIKEQLDQITALAAEITKSKALTQQAVTSAPAGALSETS